MRKSLFKQFNAWITAISFVISPLAPNVSAQSGRTMPGAGSSSLSATRSPANQDLSVGSYVELDESIRNDMYGTIDFPNAQLKDIVLAISKLANKNFILDRKLENRQITIISPQPVSKQEAYYAFLSALNMNGLTVVSVGKFLKVIEVKSAIQANTRVFVGNYAPPSEEIVTVLYTLKNLNAEDIERFVTEMVPRTGRVTAYPDTNTLVMTDTGINLRRVMAVLKSIDVPGHQEQLESIPIKHGSAKGIAQLIQEILEAQNPSTRRRSSRNREQQKTRGGGIISKIVPDDRTNSLVVLANGRGIKELKDLISKLDTPSGAGNGNIHIYYCKNAVAEELAATITALLSNQKTNNQSGNNNNNARTTRGRTNLNNQNTSNSLNISLTGDLKVTADKATNSLVVIASSADYTALKTILKKLDIPRRQVYVKATIMELTTSNSDEFGVAINVAANGTASAARSMPTNVFSASDFIDPSTINGLIAAVASRATVTATVAGQEQEINTVMGLIKAIDTSSVGQILHQPAILTSDNQDAEIKVTESVPVPKEETTIDASTASASTQVTFDKEDIEISLKLTPQIGEDNDLVKLKVEQSVDDFTPLQNGQIQKTKRTANTAVAVRSGDTIAIGGLQKIASSNTRHRYPLLGDLPIIGWLFKGSENNERRSNLILFLTPHIIESYQDLVQVTGAAIDERLEWSKSLKDPEDSHQDKVEEIRKKNLQDAKKDTPRSWSFKENPNNSGEDAAYLYIPPDVKTEFSAQEMAEIEYSEVPPQGVESLDAPPPALNQGQNFESAPPQDTTSEGTL